MLRILFLAALALAFAQPALSADAVPHEAVQKETNVKKEAEFKLQTTRAFLKAATQIVNNSGNQEAMSYLKMAESSAKEGNVHFNTGEFKYAIEDLSEATQMAIHAIILVKNQQDATMRDFVIEEELLMKARMDKERKLALVTKGISEVETFIRTATRLLAGENDGAAMAEIEKAKDLVETSKADLVDEEYDKAVEDIDRAYTTVTRAVKKIKISQGDIITFPRPASNDEKEILAYELKKNDAYMFFASHVIGDGDRAAKKMFSEAKALKEEADSAVDAKDAKKAIEKLKASTLLVIKATRSVNASKKTASP